MRRWQCMKALHSGSFATFASINSSMKKNYTLFIAHRGESHDAPENTLAAIDLAWHRNAAAVEIDVQLSRDKKIVVIHDENTWRVAGIDKMVADQSLAELKQLDVGRHKGMPWANERIPTLAEVCATVPKHKRLAIEIKCGAEILPILKADIETSGLKNPQITLIGFDRDVMKAARVLFPSLQICWIKSITYFAQLPEWRLELEKIIETTRQANLDGMCFSVSQLIDQDWVDKMREAGLACFVWTVDDLAEAKQLIEAGVDGIISNRPYWLKTQFGMELG